MWRGLAARGPLGERISRPRRPMMASARQQLRRLSSWPNRLLFRSSGRATRLPGQTFSLASNLRTA
jgi:hypothetical protein